MFTLTRLALAAHWINQPDMSKWLTTRDVVNILIRGGARASLLNATSGSLEAGKQADVVLFDMNSPCFAPMNEPYHLMAWAENGSSVDMALIDGRMVVEKSKVLTMDEEKVKQDARDMVEAMPIRNREIFRVIEEMTPLLRVELQSILKADRKIIE